MMTAEQTHEQTQYLAALHAKAMDDTMTRSGPAVVQWFEAQARQPNALTLLTMLAHMLDDRASTTQ